MLEGAIISSILSMFGYILIINIVSYRLYKINYNFLVFFIGLTLLSFTYFFSNIDFIYRFYYFLILLIFFTFLYKTNFKKFKFCFNTLKKDKII